MILDAYTLLADEMATDTGASTDYIDTLAAGDANVGSYFVCRVDAACTAAGAATGTFELQTSAQSDFTGGATTLLSSGAIGKASLTADRIVYKARIPAGVLRYIRGYWTVASGPMTAGSIDMFICSDAQFNALVAQI